MYQAYLITFFFFNMSFERAGYQKKEAVFEMYNFIADLVEFWSTKVYNVFMEHKSLEVKLQCPQELADRQMHVKNLP